MSAVITFFPVDNGDMTLIQLDSGRSILIDINIRASTDDGVRDVLADLRARLKKDDKERHYVDAMLLTHPDQDHCRGMAEHFHLGPLADYSDPEEGEDGKIVIREMWSSPMVFRRQSSEHKLCADAQDWATEARRRAKLFKSKQTAISGDHIQIMGEDEGDKNDGLEAILVKSGQIITKIDGETDKTFSGFLLAPKGKGDAAEEERRSKNHSSVIIRFSIANGANADATKYLAGGDALVGIWERIWTDHKSEKEVLEYHILSAPHHCSWRSLSYESWGDTDGEAEMCKFARKALGQALESAYIVASSKTVVDDEDDPPCIGAKSEYEEILGALGGTFVNTAEHKFKGDVMPMEFEVTDLGPVLQAAGSTLGKKAVMKVAGAGFAYAAVKERVEASNSRNRVEKRGETRFA